MIRIIKCGLVLGLVLVAGRLHAEDATIESVSQRFASGAIEEVPNFQKHVAPLFGRLGCNGRACHGSFQGRGGFRLSLFGFELDSDYDALRDKEGPRIDVKDPAESLILVKPTDQELHEGGKRYDKDGWQYHIFRKWIEGGAQHEKGQFVALNQLVIEPAEIQFNGKDESVQLRAIAVWEDGTREDVTPLCRFRTNDDQIAIVDVDGRVKSNQSGDTHVIVFYDKAVVPVAVMRPVSDLVGSQYPRVSTPTKVDELVVAKLRKLGIVPSHDADDLTFLRRLSLDMTGTLPSPEEIREFLADASPDKRMARIEAFLETPAFAAWWTTKLCDWTGNNGSQLANVAVDQNATRDWYDWIYERVNRNAPYDEIVEGIVLGTSRQGSESYRDYCNAMGKIYKKDSDHSMADRETLPHFWARRNFRTPEERVIGFSYSFLGIRIQCAQCHKHPFDKWTKEDFADFRGFFSPIVFNQRGSDRKTYDKMLADLKIDPKEVKGGQLRRELVKKLKNGEAIPFPEVYVDMRRLQRGRESAKGKILGEEEVELADYKDPRIALIDWMKSPENPYFAKALVNRVWAAYFGRGIVEPPDDLNLANPPSNAPLLEYLSQEFVKHDFDMKWLHRTICNSATYQRDWRPNKTNSLDKKHFSHAIPRRLDAEQVYDAVLAATTDRKRNFELREHLDGRAIAHPGPGRNARDPLSFTLTVFGRSIRESNCDCDRSADPNLLQTVFLQNDQNMLAMIERGGWVNELTGRKTRSRNGPSPAAIAAAKKRQAVLRKRLVDTQKQIKALAGKNSKATTERKARLSKQMEALRKQLAAINKQVSRTGNADNEKKVDVIAVVQEAYLRTLSRPPNSDEAATAIDFIRESESPALGLEGLLWALINTKEFIVNH